MFAQKLALGLQGLGDTAPTLTPSAIGPAWAISPALSLVSAPGAGIDPNYIAYLAGSPGATPTPPTLPATLTAAVDSTGLSTSSTDDAVNSALNELAAQGYTLSATPAPLTTTQVAQAQANNLATSCTDSIGCFTIGSAQIPETPLLLVAGLLLIYTMTQSSGSRRR